MNRHHQLQLQLSAIHLRHHHHHQHHHPRRLL
jgi:hypothetical protein